MASGVITLLTDFGLRDPFVGIMKGVILSRFAGARLVDLTHDIAPQDIAEASLWLAESFEWFPLGTVHVAVVDPGVGTDRPAIAVAAHGHFFVGPDNGLLAPATDSDKGRTVHAIDHSKLNERTPSRTFHGRDVFAPCAAAMASGISLAEVGPRLEGMAPSKLPGSSREGDVVHGVVVTVDRFGNLMTNLRAEQIPHAIEVRIGTRAVPIPIRGTYAEARAGEDLALINSFGYLEIARSGGHAASGLSLGKGSRVAVWCRDTA
jgi:S-adenosyl-L-methionine hydrolase (adenosine-forming)